MSDEVDIDIIDVLVLFSCGVWSVMLTTNLQQSFSKSQVLLDQIGFSFWINIGSSAGYLAALVIYIIAVCKN